MAIKPMMNFAMQLKHLKGVNKQALIDNVCNVRKIEALRAAEDLGETFVSALHGKRRQQAYEAFTGIDFNKAVRTFASQQEPTNDKISRLAKLIDELRCRIRTSIERKPSVKEINDVGVLKELTDKFKHYKSEAESLGIDYSDLDILF